MELVIKGDSLRDMFTNEIKDTSSLFTNQGPVVQSVVSLTSSLAIKIQYNLNGSNTDGSFTVDDSNSFFSPYKILPIAQENKYLMIFFLFYHGIVCCVYSLESPHRGDSNEYT